MLALLMLVAACRECADPQYYQIRTKTPLAESSWKCDYVAHGIGTCSSFQSPPDIVFSDSCSIFKLSQVVNKADLQKYKKN